MTWPVSSVLAIKKPPRVDTNALCLYPRSAAICESRIAEIRVRPACLVTWATVTAPAPAAAAICALLRPRSDPLLLRLRLVPAPPPTDCPSGSRRRGLACERGVSVRRRGAKRPDLVVVRPPRVDAPDSSLGDLNRTRGGSRLDRDLYRAQQRRGARAEPAVRRRRGERRTVGGSVGPRTRISRPRCRRRR